MSDIVAALRAIDTTLSIWLWCWGAITLLKTYKEYRRGK